MEPDAMLELTKLLERKIILERAIKKMKNAPLIPNGWIEDFIKRAEVEIDAEIEREEAEDG